MNRSKIKEMNSDEKMFTVRYLSLTHRKRVQKLFTDDGGSQRFLNSEDEGGVVRFEEIYILKRIFRLGPELTF